MLRADLYSVLAMSNSSTFITEKKQSRAIRRGIEQFCLDSQKIKMQECLDQFSGWESVLADYVLRNELNDVETVNFPKRIDEFQPEWDNQGKVTNIKECTTFVYAAYLPPGLHQFLIYDPVTKKAYVKDIILDLNASEFYPEFPGQIPRVGPKKPK